MCCGCGGRLDVEASKVARDRQWALDAALRPTSAECLPWLNVNGGSSYTTPPPNPGRVRKVRKAPATPRRPTPYFGLTCNLAVALPAPG